MEELLVEPFRSGLAQRALAEVVLLGAAGGALAFWVVELRLAYGVESLSHALLPGLVLATLAGLPLAVGAAAGAALAVALIALATRDERLGPDAGTAVAVTGLLGLGGLLALAPGAPPRLAELLFGDPLATSGSELAAAGALLAVSGVVLAGLHRPLVAVAFDPAAAAALGLRPARVNAALLALIALAVCVAVRGFGSLLLLALLVAPAVAVRRHARGPGAAIALGALVGALAGVVGIWASARLDVAAGAAVALALCAAAALGALIPRAGPRRPA